MSATARILATLLLLASCLVGGREAAAGGPADAAAKARATALRARATEWFDARTRLVDTCNTCKGNGSIVRWVGRSVYRDTCPSCHGQKKYISVKRWQMTRYDVYSPARRLTMKLEDVQAARAAADPSHPDTGYLKTYRIDRVELVGASLGRVYAVEGKDTVVRETRWIEVTSPTTQKVEWCLYSPETDGEWVEPVPEAANPAPAPSKVEPLKAAEFDLLRQKVGLSKVKGSLEYAQREEETLILTTFDRSAKDVAALDAAIAADVYPLAEVAFVTLAEPKSVRILFTAWWRDRLGEKRKRPYRSAEISRELFQGIHPERLTPRNSWPLFTIQDLHYEGEVLWWTE